MNNNLNLPTIDQEQALNLVKFFIKAKQNCFLLGRRGCGKSEIIMQAADECGYKVNYINLSVIERADLAGYPDMHAVGDVVNFKSPAFLPTLEPGKQPDTIILFDEVDKVSPDITAPLLEILLYKKINGRALNIASCMLTGNLASEKAYSNYISSALLDRGAKYILEFNFNRWVDWARENNINDLILGFLRSNPEYCVGKLSDDTYASPSPRGWTLASNALDHMSALEMLDLHTVNHIISGYVGNEAGLKFMDWFEYYRKFEPQVHSIIDDQDKKFKFESLTPSERLVFVITACYYAKARSIKTGSVLYIENLCKFFKNYKVDPEMQVMGLTNSFEFEMIQKYGLYKSKIFFDLFEELNNKLIAKS